MAAENPGKMAEAGGPTPEGSAWHGVGERPANAGRRLAMLLVIIGAVLAGSVVGLFWWIRATSRAGYEGPEKLAYPEHRPFRG